MCLRHGIICSDKRLVQWLVTNDAVLLMMFSACFVSNPYCAKSTHPSLSCIG